MTLVTFSYLVQNMLFERSKNYAVIYSLPETINIRIQARRKYSSQASGCRFWLL
ncbi:hypothetical protein DSUL_90065 [Desulfovibrionales bacterium]